MSANNRQELLKKLLASSPAYRLKQIRQSIFDPRFTSWSALTSLDLTLRRNLENSLPYLSVSQNKVVSSPVDGSQKAVLALSDGLVIETVLMPNSRGQYTVCLSSQVGCAMACGFCSTGKMGLKRNLTSDEIIDQYRFWLYRLNETPGEKGLITNLVIMGMGEPFANYQNLKDAVNEILAYTEIGPTRITVSTIGLFPALNRVLTDEDWPNIRLAVSLHAPDLITRKKIILKTVDTYFSDLAAWARAYLKKFGNRSHYLSFEYIMIKDVNDSLDQAKKLAVWLKKIGQVKVNLIPCNDSLNEKYKKSAEETIRNFSAYLIKNGIRSTVRQSRGQDILAACGQLIAKEKTLSP